MEGENEIGFSEGAQGRRQRGEIERGRGDRERVTMASRQCDKRRECGRFVTAESAHENQGDPAGFGEWSERFGAERRGKFEREETSRGRRSRSQRGEVGGRSHCDEQALVRGVGVFRLLDFRARSRQRGERNAGEDRGRMLGVERDIFSNLQRRDGAPGKMIGIDRIGGRDDRRFTPP